VIRLFHLQNPPIQSDNYETNALDPCCLSGNGHGRPETQGEGSNLHVSTGLGWGGSGGEERWRGCLGVWEIPHFPQRQVGPQIIVQGQPACDTSV